jgi:hypothetical protein
MCLRKLFLYVRLLDASCAALDGKSGSMQPCANELGPEIVMTPAHDMACVAVSEGAHRQHLLRLLPPQNVDNGHWARLLGNGQQQHCTNAHTHTHTHMRYLYICSTVYPVPNTFMYVCTYACMYECVYTHLLQLRCTAEVTHLHHQHRYRLLHIPSTSAHSYSCVENLSSYSNLIKFACMLN